MKRPCALGLTALLLSLSGCAITGQWMLDEVEPLTAREDVQFDTLNLEPDGRYYAELNREGTRTTSGHYTYRNGVLRLVDDNGMVYHFDATLTQGGHQLELVRFWNGQKVRVEFEKST